MILGCVREACGPIPSNSRKNCGALKTHASYVPELSLYTIVLYYGAADTSIALATGSVGAMLEWLEKHE